MKIQGSYEFNAPPDQVWQVLLDPQIIQACIPGCKKLEPNGENRYRAVITAGIGPIKGSFQGTVTLADLEKPRRYRLIVEGGGVPGFVKGESTLSLEPKGAGTTVAVTSDVQVGGTIASVGQRLMGGVAKKLMDSFFNCLREKT